jgi:DNA-binding GntR family transcriptional regulator
MSTEGDTANGNSVYRSVERPSTRRGTLAEEIAAHVRSLVLTGALRPGEKIDQEAIATVLDVSRSPIREALVVLGQEGLLDVTPRRGAFVAELTREDVIDHYELFGTVSGRVAEMAAERFTDLEIEELKAVHERFSQAPASEQSKYNNEFHKIVNSVAPRRTRWLLSLLERSIPANFYDFVDGWDSAAEHGHDEIVEAIVARDGAAARRAMEQHLHDSGVAAADSLLARGFWEPT